MNNAVTALACDAGGSLYAGGSFTNAGGIAANCIAKWDGSSWTNLGSGMNYEVSALTCDAGGNLYAGGWFTTAGGVAANCIAKWDGSSWTNLGSGMNSMVTALVCNAGGNLYVGGDFTTAGGVAANCIAKWDGSSWTNLGSGMNGMTVYGGMVKALACDARGNLYVGGWFNNAGGVAANYIAKWDGSSWTNLGSGMNNAVTALACDAGGSLYAGGSFTNAGGIAANYIAKWVPDSTIGISPSALSYTASYGGPNPAAQVFVVTNMGQTVFDFADTVSYSSGAGGWFIPSVTTGTLSAAGSLTVTGNVDITGLNAGTYMATNTISSATAMNSPQTLVATLTVNDPQGGQTWTNLGSGMSLSGTVLTLACDAGGSLYAGGNFTIAGGIAVNRIAKWDGSSWTNLGSGMNAYGTVMALACDAGGSLYAGGWFTNAGGVTANCIAKWDGSSWTNLGSGMNANAYFYGTVSALVCNASGNLYAGGSFTNAGGVTANCIAKWDGSSWTNLGSGMNANGAVSALACDAGGNLYAEGLVNVGGFGSVNCIAKWDGSSWTNLGSNIIFEVAALACDAGGNLYAGGRFTNVGGVAANCIARWDGSSWTNLGGGMSANDYATLKALACDAGGNLYAGGWFTNAGGIAANCIAKWVPGSAIGISPSALNYTAAYGGINPAAQVFVVTNMGQTVFDFADTVSYSSGAGGWFIPSVTTGTLSAAGSLTVTGNVDITGLNAGTYMATNTISSINYGFQDLVVTLTIGKTHQVALIFRPASPQVYNTTNGLSVTGGSGTGAVNYNVISGPGQIVGAGSLRATAGTGVICVAAVKAADNNYNVMTVTALVTAVRADQVITFPAIADQITTNTVGLSATASSGLLVTNFALILGPGVVSGTNLTFTNSGSVSVSASQAGNMNWNAAPAVTNIFNVGMAAAVVTLTNLTQTYDGTPRVVTATTVPGGLSLTITYNGSGSAPTAAGNYAITGVVNSALYQGSANGTLTVSKATAIVTLNNLNQTYDGTARIVTGTTAPASLAVLITYDGSATAPVNVGSYAVIGTVNEASYAGATNGTLAVAKANQTITFPAIPDQEVASVVTLSATASSGLTISYSAAGPTVLNGNTLTFTGAGTVSIIASQAGNANWNAAANVTRNVTVNAAPPPSVPTGVQASDGTYTDKVRVTWNAASDATCYQVWRSISNNIAIGSNLATTAITTYDDLSAATMPGTILYYWVRVVNAAGASGFSTNDTGYVKPAIGPTIKANGAVGDVTINYPDAMAITVEMNEDPYAGAPVEWWVLSLAGSSWYYLNDSIQWTPFNGNLSKCHPLYQGASCNLPATLLPELNVPGLPVSSYTFWFAVDPKIDGILNVDGPIMADSVNVTMLSTAPAPSVKANGATGIVTVNYPQAVAITMEMNARAYAGVPVDWWFLLYAGSSWYYLNDSVQWTPFNWNISKCHPFYQGALFDFPAVPILVGSFPRGTYDFYFAVDYPMDGILSVEQCWVYSVKVNVQ